MSIRIRKLLLVLTDMIFINVSLCVALLIRFDMMVPDQYYTVFLQNALIATIIQIAIFYLFGLYKSLWEYASIEELLQIIYCHGLSWQV